MINGRGSLTETDGRRYTGELLMGRFHGQGTLIWPDGRKYAGSFRDGEPHGPGRMTLPDGSFYEGRFEQGRAVGEISRRSLDGSRYKGGFVGAAREGYGTLILPDGSRYEGFFRHDLYHGRGKLTAADGKVLYEGEFKAGQPAAAGGSLPELPAAKAAAIKIAPLAAVEEPAPLRLPETAPAGPQLFFAADGRLRSRENSPPELFSGSAAIMLRSTSLAG